jgi:Kef-type K+ transport system membrane component KefB
MFNRSISPLVIVFLIIGGLVLAFREAIEKSGFDWQVLSGGNLFLYLITVVSMHMLSKGLHAENTQVFLRNAYGGIMVKLFACAAVAFIYILAVDGEVNKPSLFACMGFYIIYTAIELKVIMKQSKERKNAKN